ncbi:glycosyltransferase [Capnocytophaga canimorsus]|uniref:glycosyltransferase n=1 Tax=Capnocytophaga canimorsus TaxID=28188 RepID=UPI0037D774F1
MIYFGIVIPAHNEAQTIEATLNSLLEQSYKSFQIIVVDDHSTDNTSLILERLAKNHSCIRVVRNENGTTHLPGAKVVKAFNAGLPFVTPNTNVICKFDADLIFPSNYLEQVAHYFTQFPNIGMCGGVCYTKNDEDWALEDLTNLDHLRGPIKAYRKTCFEAIGGLKEAMGWDTADELLARFYGWEVKIDPKLHVKHLRPTGAGYSREARYLQGSVFYRLRYGFLLSLLASAKLAYKKHQFSLFFDYIIGYFKAKKTLPYLVTAEQGKWIRAYRRKAIIRKFFPFLG